MKKVLIIEDDEGIIEATQIAIEMLGYEVQTLTKGDTVQETVKEFKPDVIMLDLLLSGMDGKEICKKLKKDPETAVFPVIMLSAHPTAKISAEEAGADYFLPKPFDVNELLEKVEKLANRHHNVLKRP